MRRRSRMARVSIVATVAVGIAALCGGVASATTVHVGGQHRTTGTVESVNAKIKMTEIETDNGTSGHFECAS